MKKLLLMILLFVSITVLTGCYPQVDEGQVVVKDNTAELNALENSIEDLQDMIESLEAALPSESDPVDVDLSGIEDELGWIEDELELMRQLFDEWDVDWTEGFQDITDSYVDLEAYIASLTSDGEEPVIPPTVIYIKVDSDYYIVWSSGDIVYKLIFSHEKPLLQDERIVLQSISKEVAYNVDGIFYYETFYLDSPGLYTTQLVGAVTVDTVLEGWLVTDISLVADFYDAVRTCTLTATCSTNVPTFGTVE